MILLTVLIWTFNFLAAKVALREMSPYTLAPLRVELAALIMLALYAATSRRSAGKAPAHATWSPGRMSVTPSPTSTTTPALL